ncbi:MAG: S9 family peptidase [Acidobacteria bacterium]|nr:S9 family peptidase [Acidobacteriota bacterium]
MDRNARSLLQRTLAALVVLAALAAAQAKRPIGHKDFDAWRSISAQTLSRDGKYLAYAYMPQDGDGDLILRELATGKEWKEPVGALPPPVIAQPDAEGPPPPPRSIRIAFTSDGKYLVAGTYPPKAETEKAKKEKKRPEEMPKQGLLIMKVGSGEVTRISQVKSFQVPEKGSAWLAYLKEAPPAAKPAEPAKPAEQDEADEDQQRRGGGGTAGGAAGTGARKEYGTELVLRDLAKAENNERSFANALEYSFARDGKNLVWAVSSRKEEENGVFAVVPGSDTAPAALKAGKGKYSKLAWDREQAQLAFIAEKSACVWDRKSAAAEEMVTAQTAGLPQGMVVSDKGTVSFSRDGKRLFVPVAPPAKETKEGEAAASTEDKVLMDLWHWRDEQVQPMQKVRVNQERNRTYRGVWHIADKKYVQLATPNMQNVQPSDDGLLAVGLDDRPWRRMADYDGSYQDVYIVDAVTGQRKNVIRQLRGGGGGGGFGGGPLQLAPDGKHAFYFNDRAWHLMSLPDGASRNVTGALKTAFHDELHDSPDAAPSYGQAGWAKDSASFYVYDRYDVWQIFADGRAARNVTSGEGRKAKVQFRITRIDPVEEDDDRGIDPARPLTLRAENEDTRETGFYRVTAGGAPQRLLWGAKNYRFALRAKDADVVLITAQRFDEYPDLHVTNSSFSAPGKATSGGAQMAPFLWGTSELIGYRNTDGVALKAALYKPAAFDPKKKYPLMVYIYERLSQSVFGFVEPRPGTSINYSQYVSDGYVVLTPDIVYTVGNPGQSALKCVLAAIDKVVEMGFIDEARIGIQGHSWGGYQIAYMVTQTNRFRAAEAGAPVGNMTSAYSGIRWGSGMPRQFQYEKTQSRIGPTLYDNPLKYLENSPIFHIRRVQTPLLILHDDNDDAVPWYQGIELYLAMRRTGKEVYLMNYNGEFHGLRRRHNQKDYTVRMKQFFDHFLKDGPKPEWMEKGVPFIEREEEKERFQTQW